MQIARPMEILSIDNNTAAVSADGVTEQVRLDIIDSWPEVGDHVIAHAGFALCLIRKENGTTSRDSIHGKRENGISD